MKFFLKHRRILISILHLGFIVWANYLAFWLRFDGDIPDNHYTNFILALPWLIVIRGLMFIPFRLYEGLWRYTGLWDLRNITLGVLTSTPIFYAVTTWGLSLTSYPRSVFIIDSLVLIVFLVGIRLTRRLHHELGKVDREKRVLIYGGGNAGERIIANMQTQESFFPVGIVDDDMHKVGQRIHGVRVLGTQKDLPKIINRTDPHEILIAIPSAEPAQIRSIVSALEPFKIPIKTLPSLEHIFNGKVTVNEIRDLSMEDLLLRTPLELNPEPLRFFIEGKCVMVTGAGGSIGSELCRQISKLEPESLILFEQYENGLYDVVNDLSRNDCMHPIYPIIGDITDIDRLDHVIENYRPQIIFHAAAHKHVPLMELNPCEAVKNNVVGTRNVVESASRHDVEKFVLISTDKAVNPSSVMGATKRIAEYIIQGINERSRTSFEIVRFGNVLGSNGSVVPIFLDQIRKRKPVTITHPGMRRFFMSIPEAVSLILHAGAMESGGNIYVLDMGEQIKLVDLARNLIRLAGYVPEEEIPIEFIGLRPGEKLYEELVESGEITEPSSVEKINVIHTTDIPDYQELIIQIEELKHFAERGDFQGVITKLSAMIPSYKQPVDITETPSEVIVE